MKAIERTSQFKKDVKRMQKRGKRFDVFKTVVEKLANGEELGPKHRDHALVGNYSGTRECHLEPDWLLIYEQTADSLILIRTGSHADLFK